MREDNFIEWRILAGKLRGTLSSKEEQEFQAWYDASIRHRKYFERLGKLWDSGEESEIRVDVEAMIRDFDRRGEEKENFDPSSLDTSGSRGNSSDRTGDRYLLESRDETGRTGCC